MRGRLLQLLAPLVLLRWHALSSPVPRTIYTYWQSGPLPWLATQCIRTWAKHCKLCEVHVITGETVLEYIPRKPPLWDSFSASLQSDILRLEVLSARGGIWLDATIVATDNSFFERVFSEAANGALVGFDVDLAPPPVDFRRGLETGDWGYVEEAEPLPAGHPSRIFESWALGSLAGSETVRSWRDELLVAAAGPERYCTEWKELFTDDHPLASWLPYLIIHASLVSVRARVGAELSVLRAEDSAYLWRKYTPSHYLVRLMRPADFWMDGTGMPVFALGRSPSAVPRPQAVGGLVKFRSLDRDALRHIVDCAAYAEGSPLQLLLGLGAVPSLWPVQAVQLLAGLSLLLEREHNLPCRVLSSALQALLQFLVAWWPLPLLALPSTMLSLSLRRRLRLWRADEKAE